MKIARVFPRRTAQSPDDVLAFFDDPPELFPPQVDEVHVSVAFTYDIPEAERLAKAWAHIAPVKIGGPAFGKPSGDFVPGRHVKQGITFTSRGCPNRCWFCSVHKREPKLIELPIMPGYIIQDDNLLACSRPHIEAVFTMLEAQEQRVMFLGGLESRLLEPWHMERLRTLNPGSIYFAYDTADDLEPLRYAGELLYEYGFGWPCRVPRCFVLIGYKGDTFEAAERRFHETIAAGFWPLAMLWKDKDGNENKEWRKFSRIWARPAIYFQEAMTIHYGANNGQWTRSKMGNCENALFPVL